MDLIKQINELKKEKNAIILTHCYQEAIIDEVSDFVGDSLYLSKMAAKTDADIIVFAGVYFMAQSAKLLSPSKKVLLPNINSGCLMAEMIDVENLKIFKEKHPNIPVVCYINSTAEVKSVCDISFPCLVVTPNECNLFKILLYDRKILSKICSESLLIF